LLWMNKNSLIGEFVRSALTDSMCQKLQIFSDFSRFLTESKKAKLAAQSNYVLVAAYMPKLIPILTFYILTG